MRSEKKRRAAPPEERILFYRAGKTGDLSERRSIGKLSCGGGAVLYRLSLPLWGDEGHRGTEEYLAAVRDAYFAFLARLSPQDGEILYAALGFRLTDRDLTLTGGLSPNGRREERTLARLRLSPEGGIEAVLPLDRTPARRYTGKKTKKEGAS